MLVIATMSLEPSQGVCFIANMSYYILGPGGSCGDQQIYNVFDVHCEIHSTYMQAYCMHMCAILPICLFRHGEIAPAIKIH